MNPAKDPNGTPGTPEGATTAWPWSLACLSLSMLMPSLDTSIANLALPTLARALGASFHQAQWVVLAYLLALTSLIVGAGRLGDLLGRRRLLLAGILLFTGASLLCGSARGLGLLLAARAVQGLGAAAMISSTLALAGEAVPRARTGLAMGLLGTMSAIGTMLGPSIGGVLIAGFGWRSIFLVNVPLGLLNLWLAGRQLPADRPRPAGNPRFDLPGALLLALTLAAYALAMTLERGAAGPVRLALLAAAGLGAAGFARLEAAAADPLVPVARLREPALRGGLVMNVLVATVMMTTLVVGPFYLSLALGLAPAQVGLVMAAGPLVSTLSGPLAGQATDHFGAPAAVLAGLGAMAAGASGLALIPASFGPAGYLAAMLVLTPGYQLFQAANNAAVLADADPDQRGVLSGLLSLARNLGLITGAAVMGTVFARASAAAGPGSVAAGFRTTFGVAAALILAAAAMALRARREPAPGGREAGAQARS